MASKAEEFLRATVEAAFKGDARGFLNNLTSEAFVDVMQIGTTFSDITKADGYSVDPLDESGEEHRFRLRVKAPERVIEATTTVTQVDGQWRVTAVKIPGVRD